MDLKTFINKATNIHNNKYDYSISKYVNWYTKLKIICNIHKLEFEQTPTNHIHQKSGCYKCSLKKRSLSRQISKLIAKRYENHENFLLIKNFM